MDEQEEIDALCRANREESLVAQVLAYVPETSGWFTASELDHDLHLLTQAEHDNRRQILLRLKKEGIIEQHPRFNKQFRYVNKAVTRLDYKNAARSGALNLKWPLGIEQYVSLYAGNMAVVAGSPNAGKTALLLNFIRLNQEEFTIRYLCSEMGEAELRERLEMFPNIAIDKWKFDAISRASDFAEVISPDCINIIDFLEITTELYLVNEHLIAISKKLGSGLAVIALQKKAGAQLGRGAEFSLEKPKLYLSLDAGKITIVKGKAWARKDVNPNGLSVKFRLLNGCDFTRVGDWSL